MLKGWKAILKLAVRELLTVAPRFIQSTLQFSSTGHIKQKEIDGALTKFVVETNSPFVNVKT